MLGAVVLGGRRGHQTSIFTISPLQDLLASFSSVSVGAWARGLLTVLLELYLVIWGDCWKAGIQEEDQMLFTKYSLSSLGGMPDLFTTLKSEVANSPTFLNASEFLGQMEFTARAGI